MNSSIYTCKVMHNRLSPKKHSFWYHVYLFYLDLDEIPALADKITFFGFNKFNLFNFRDSDHMQLPKDNPDLSRNVRAHLTTYLAMHDVCLGTGRVMLLTNMAVLGYNFNPVCFYFCDDEQGAPLCAVVEITNTYHEKKLFFISKAELEDGHFRQRAEKYFYVSPFTDLDTLFDFNLAIPDGKLDIRIDDYDQHGNRFFISTLTGSRQPLNNRSLLKYFFSIPLIPLWVMAMIHWQAFLLWRKKLSFHPKAGNPGLQKDVYNRYQTKNNSIYDGTLPNKK